MEKAPVSLARKEVKTSHFISKMEYSKYLLFYAFYTSSDAEQLTGSGNCK